MKTNEIMMLCLTVCCSGLVLFCRQFLLAKVCPLFMSGKCHAAETRPRPAFINFLGAKWEGTDGRDRAKNGKFYLFIRLLVGIDTLVIL